MGERNFPLRKALLLQCGVGVLKRRGANIERSVPLSTPKIAL